MKLWEGALLLKEAMLERAKNLQPRSIYPTAVIMPASASGTQQALPDSPGLCILGGICQAYSFECVMYESAEMVFQLLILTGSLNGGRAQAQTISSHT